MSSALTVVQSQALSYGDMLRPKSLTEAMELAKLLANSDMVPKDYKGKPGNVLAAVQMGAELGLAPMQSLQNIAVINGRPSVWGDALLGLCQAQPDFEDIQETDDGETATCMVKRRGRAPVTRTFSMADAKQAGLLGKQGPWSNYPKRMRQMRARGFALRDAYADALKGLNSAEEQADIPLRAEVVQPEAATPPVAAASKQSPNDRVKGRLAPPASEATVELGNILLRIDEAENERELAAVSADAKKLSGADQEKARAAYKAKRQQLLEPEPPHDAQTGEVYESSFDDAPEPGSDG